MVPGALVVQWMSERGQELGCHRSGETCERCAYWFASVWGPRLQAEMILREAERLLAKDLTPTERAEAEALRFRTREVIAVLERAVMASA